jgi:predicted aminopeptidase
MVQVRARLAATYAAGGTPDELRARKQAVLDGGRAEYQALRAGWPPTPGWDAFTGLGFNNARLAAVGVYHQHVRAFRRLFAAHGGDFAAFHRTAAELGALAPAARAERLAALDRED